MESEKIVIIGAGIVGVFCALELQKTGAKVSIVDSQAPGLGCSFGNAGGISPGAVVPYSMPGTLLNVPRWLLSSTGPLVVRPGYMLTLFPWLLQWLKASRPEQAKAISRAMHSLHKSSLDVYLPLLRDIGEADMIRSPGQLYVSQQETGIEGGRLAQEMRDAAGVKTEVLSGSEVQELEPSLSSRYRSGLFFPNNGNCSNPHRLVDRLAGLFVSRGGKIICNTVVSFEFGPDGPCALLLGEGGKISFDKIVVAAGARSNVLTSMLGTKVPLVAERGYHVTIPEPGVTPKIPVSNRDYSFAVTPMEMGLRFAGTAEFADVDATPDWRRADVLLELGAQMFPGLRSSNATRWMGGRPSLPDGLPVLDRSPLHHKAFFAFGNGHFGLMAAPMMGKAIAELVAGQTPSIDLSPFRANRFGRNRKNTANV